MVELNENSYAKRDARHARRYRRLALSQLANGAPDVVVKAFIRELESVVGTRRHIRWGESEETTPHPDCHDDFCVHCRPSQYFLRRSTQWGNCLVRLTNYPDMQKAWNTIYTHKREGAIYRHNWAQRADADLVASMLLDEIRGSIEDFDKLPQSSAAERKKKATRIAKLSKALAEAIDEDDDARQLARTYLADYIGVRHLLFRAENGEKVNPALSWIPRLSYQSLPDDRYDGEWDESDWHKWPSDARFGWLCREIDDTALSVLLSTFSTAMTSISEDKPAIARWGSGDPRVRYLVDRLSTFMKQWFGSPIDETVACFVSAALDLPDSLNVDDIKPRRKRSRGT